MDQSGFRQVYSIINTVQQLENKIVLRREDLYKINEAVNLQQLGVWVIKMHAIELINVLR